MIFFLKEDIIGCDLAEPDRCGVKLILVAALLQASTKPVYSFSVEFLPIPFALGADANSVLFVTCPAFSGFAPRSTRSATWRLAASQPFFGFFSLCVTATTGIALSANLVTSSRSTSC